MNKSNKFMAGIIVLLLCVISFQMGEKKGITHSDASAEIAVDTISIPAAAASTLPSDSVVSTIGETESSPSDISEKYGAYEIKHLSIKYYCMNHNWNDNYQCEIKSVSEDLIKTTIVTKSRAVIAGYNVSPYTLTGTDNKGNKIDLKKAIKDNTSTSSGSESTSVNNELIPNPQNYTYIINKKSKKIHLFSCGTAYNAYENNPGRFMGTYESLSKLESEGFSLCGNCLD